MRILLLDYDLPYIVSPVLGRESHVDVELVEPECSSTIEWFRTVLDSIHDGTLEIDANSFDRIVLGHNIGKGIEIARLLPESAATKTIIVANDPLSDSDQEPYRALGFSRFDIRRNIANLSFFG